MAHKVVQWQVSLASGISEHCINQGDSELIRGVWEVNKAAAMGVSNSATAPEQETTAGREVKDHQQLSEETG